MLEKIQRPLPSLRRVLSDFGGVYAGNALVAFLFAVSGPLAIILSVGAMGGLSESDILIDLAAYVVLLSSVIPEGSCIHMILSNSKCLISSVST